MRNRIYTDSTWPLADCEHCDGVHSKGLTRYDHLRGNVCRYCDGVLDEMFPEEEESSQPEEQC